MEFKKRYFKEFEGRKELNKLRSRARKEIVTLVYGVRNKEFNHAIALKECLEPRLA